jgi:hypothetical protein
MMVEIGNNFTKPVVSTKPHAKTGVMKQIGGHQAIVLHTEWVFDLTL